MRAEEASPATELVDRYHLCFALGKALEDRDEIAESWHYYERGNALKRSESRYRPEIIETNTAQADRSLHAGFLRCAAPAGATRAPIRSSLSVCRASGSTLLEQILASHSQVEGTQELADIQRIVLELQGRDPDLDNPRYPAALAEMTRGGFPPAGREISGRYASLSDGQAVLHRQDAEQFPPYRPDPSDAAQCADHRRAARADVLLLQQPEAAFRPGAGIHLQRRGHRTLLPDLSRI